MTVTYVTRHHGRTVRCSVTGTVVYDCSRCIGIRPHGRDFTVAIPHNRIVRIHPN